ncbi:hypothetical protein [Microbacterium sp. Mcb102]|uniref:hypothetical protein n=1 Tax=Microbacterium sp. Mcb102 TaxID=2926012 RepID=UPI0021C5A374|nr:hypothetical protein [Microbacterium sp. Mcb102]
MNVFGVLLSLAGSILFLTALAMTLRANATSTVPFWRNPAETPVGSVAMRSIGAGLLVFGAVMLTAEGWRWPVLIVLVVPGIAFVALALHNRRIAATTGGD